MSKLTPFENNVLIKQEDNTEQMYGSILVPDMGKERPLVGEIISVSEGYTNMMTGIFMPTKLKVGEKVVFPSFGGQRITVGGEEFLIYKEQDILAKIED